MAERTNRFRRSVVVVVLLGIVISGILAYAFRRELYLFRTETLVPAAVPTELRWRWGALREMALDINRDGMYDFVGTYGGWSRDASFNDPFVSSVASSSCDGHFDVQIRPLEGGEREIQFDYDGDGLAETYGPDEGFRRMARTCEEWLHWIPPGVKDHK